jgi:alkanesulfonate monooxygenase SsuD/methylene tetrahydromethanopterin reductase-like flavin-dependent oxidoreductase (luciferase family)
MLDVMNEGRIVVLFLRGTPNEVLVYRANPDESREITQEGIELILRAWTEPQPFGWEGRYFNYRTVSVWPRTFQEPHPRVFSSGNTRFRPIRGTQSFGACPFFHAVVRDQAARRSVPRRSC